MSFEAVGLWQRTLGHAEQLDQQPRERLRQAYLRLREGVRVLAAEIHRDLPDFTVHDITHIDALWGVADTIVGPNYPLNPLEGFVLGGAFLVHDLGMGLASWPGRRSDLMMDPRWRDTVAALLLREHHRAATSAEISDPPDHVKAQATRELLRLLHAEHAERLLEITWQNDEGGPAHLLLEDKDLRFHLGPLIGKIAHSHWWNADGLREEFRIKKGALSGFPGEWAIDPLKVAALLRAADAAHLDDRRAPRLLRAARGLSGVARSHWIFQGHMLQIQEKDGRLEFSATRPFATSEAAAWWLAHETLQMVNRELLSVDSLLADENRPRFAARSVAGIESPTRLKTYIPVRGWEPVEARVRVGDIPAIVERLGGRELYGDDLTVPLRELIQNASDAVCARRLLDGRPNQGRIDVRLGRDEQGTWLEVEDDGVGMSRAVLTGPLLDFGETYWSSLLCREEHQGLTAKGFEPVGRYGIGFFSIFMLGERVRVTSRRYDMSMADTRVLEFSDGLRTGPVLRNAARDEYVRDGGTRVRVWFKEGLEAQLRDCHLAVGDDMFKHVCTKIAPALEVDLWSHNGSGKEESVVRGGDWRTMPGRELMRRIVSSQGDFASNMSSRTEEWLEEFGALLRPIVDDRGDCVGRVCIGPMDRDDARKRSDRERECILTVGGLRTGAVKFLCGILHARPIRADRQSAIPLVSAPMLSRWASEQGRILAETKAPIGRQIHAARVINHLGGNVDGLHIAADRSGWLTLKQIEERFAEAPEVILVDHNELKSFGDKRGVRVNSKRVLDDNVLAVPTRPLVLGRSLLCNDQPSNSRADAEWPLLSPERSNGPGSEPNFDEYKQAYARGLAIMAFENRQYYAKGLVRPVVEALAKAWHVPEARIWDASIFAGMPPEDDDFDANPPFFMRIGEIDGEPVATNVCVIRAQRPGRTAEGPA